MSLFGSVKDTLFGEGPSVSTQSLLTDEQQKLLNELIGQLNPGEGVDAYGGDIYAGASDLNQGLFSAAGDILGGGGGQGQDILDQLLDKYSSGDFGATEFDPTATTEMFKTSVADPARDAFQDTLSGIAEKYAGHNAGRSGAMIKTMADAAGDLETGLSGQLSSLLYDAENQNTQNNLTRETNYENNAASVLQNLMGTAFDQPLETINSLLGIAGTEQAIDQSQLTEDYEKWNTEQAYNNPWLQFINSMLGQTQETVVDQGSTGLIESLSPLMLLAGL